jgi:hypothetical protein
MTVRARYGGKLESEVSMGLYSVNARDGGGLFAGSCEIPTLSTACDEEILFCSSDTPLSD